MSLTATKTNGGGGDFEPVPTGLHDAILIWIVDLGLQDTPWGEKPRVMFTWELPRVLMEIDGEHKPKVLSRELSPFIHEKSNLGKYLFGWFGKMPDGNIDLRTLAGQHCTVNVGHTTKGDKTYANIVSISPPTEQGKELVPYNDIIVWEFGKGQPLPETLPEWIRVKVMNSREWNELGQFNDVPPVPTADDAPPF
jgi:hypothetical protein